MRVVHKHTCPVQDIILCYRVCCCVTALSTATSYCVLLICFVVVFSVMEGSCMAGSYCMQKIKTLRKFINSVQNLSSGRIFKIICSAVFIIAILKKWCNALKLLPTGNGTLWVTDLPVMSKWSFTAVMTVQYIVNRWYLYNKTYFLSFSLEVM
jgi:hypothetical protein